ncbi:M26 family metallopeptidase [Gracilimonas halophila]|uniref:The GLUG motif-containing protein n=1 Tax=Gracilimonas halophila TaxID=1834464 RepID=A0ABW5JJY3_9BACT
MNGNDYVGGLVGSSYFDAIITSSYTSVSVIGGSYVGGLVGFKQGTITDSYSIGSVSGSDNTVGGFIGGIENSNVSNSFWAIETSGQSTSAGGTGKTSAELKSLSTFTDAGWDVAGETANGTDDIWTIKESGSGYISYPYLTSISYDTPGADPAVNPIPGLVESPYAGGSGTEADPFQIETWEHLHNVRENLDAHFVLNNDLDETTEGYATYVKDGETLANDGKGWEPIGTKGTEFTGAFNGGGHIISGLHIQRSATDYVGLFGATGFATIEDLGLVNVDITGADKVGSIAGSLSGPLKNSYATGAVSGKTNVGGLAGELYGYMENVYSLVDVSGDSYVGGLVGVGRSEAVV